MAAGRRARRRGEAAGVRRRWRVSADDGVGGERPGLRRCDGSLGEVKKICRARERGRSVVVVGHGHFEKAGTRLWQSRGQIASLECETGARATTR